MRANLIAALIGLVCAAGCGGGGGSAINNGSTTGTNVQSVQVDTGPPAIANSNSPAVNTLYTSVKICAPGSTSNCQTIDHIQVDTGSSGLRIISTVLSVTLPLQTSGGKTIAECVRFVDGSSWGPLRTADILIAGETASNLAVQIIGDPAYPIPAACSGTGTTENTVAAFGANGILGIGPFIQDCGPACTVAGGGVYYTCTSGTACTDTAMPLAMQVSNPVNSFATDNNGVIIQLPSVSSTGQASVSGSLIFGIGTQSNNGLGTAQVLTLDANGALGTNYKNTSLNQSFIDSGSNALYFPDSSIPVCGAGGQASTAPGFFCPAGTLNLTGSIVGLNQVSAAINFSVANAESLFSTNATIAAVVNLAGSSTTVSSGGTGDQFNGNSTFDWGLPFYFGRSVATAIETRNTSAGMGPYFAF